MARIRAFATTSVAAAAVGAALLSMATPANADPSGFRTYAGVGSDTIQDVMNAASGDVSGTTGIFAAGLVGSYNAFGTGAAGTATIQTKSGGPTFTRPVGSTQGRQALYASVTGTTFKGTNIADQVDFARSSAFLAQGAAGTSSDQRIADYVPFARDGVSYIYKGGTASKVGKLTTAQLTQIYSAATPVTINGVKITGYLPQTSSGTRSFFLGAIGVTSPGASVVTVGAENDGTQLPAGTTTAANIIPFSAAQYIAQTNGVVTDLRDSAALAMPNGKTVYSVNKNTGKAAPNVGFFNTAPFGRSVYNVIDDATATQALKNVFVNNGSKKAPLCGSAGLALSAKYGFAAINNSKTGQTCGVVVQGAYPTPAP